MLIGRILLALLVFTPCTSSADPIETLSIPEQLLPWKEWVLHGYEEQLQCVPNADNNTLLQCDWPSELTLTINKAGGSFTQKWTILHEKWIQLPGDEENWPGKVEVNGKSALVIGRQLTPWVKLKQGTYTIRGAFTWDTVPEYLQVPEHTGVVSLEISGKPVEFPELDRKGRLWLQTQKSRETPEENRLTLQSFKFIDDRIPLKIDILMQLEVSGAPREVTLGPLFSLERFVPVSLTSSIPARLEPDGRLRLQVRPGQWSLTLTTRHLGPATELQFVRPNDDYWPREEIWVYHSQPDLRVVEIEGVPAIDPLQTSLPPEWQRFPAYRVLESDTMLFKEIKRGDPQPAPDQLSMNRNIWLRFDGSGYTIQDTITGTKNTDWRLEMLPPIQLGRVAVDGQEQFITKLDQSGKNGVELRKGILHLVADSQYADAISRLPATGWDHDFQQVNARLFLPPGWKLISASGMDNISGTWVKRWTLLDFFVVLLLTIALARLFSRKMAVLGFVTLVLLYHEPGAPRWIWLSILICVALLRHLPEGRIIKSIKILQVINILVLIAVAIPFSVEQLRTGIFPQLEKPWQSMSAMTGVQPATRPEPVYEQKELQDDIPAEIDTSDRLSGRLEPEKRYRRLKSESAPGSYDLFSTNRVAQYDPSMVNQTGPGLPYWQWNVVPMSWSGPVQISQEISFILLNPAINLIISFARVILLVILTLGIFKLHLRQNDAHPFVPFKTFFLVPFLLLVCLFPPSYCSAGEIPSPEMLDELRKRFLEKEDCFPECADISRMTIHITQDQLQLTLHASAQTDVSIPLPGNIRHWIPQAVKLDNQPVDAMFRTGDQLRILITKGEHLIDMQGRIPQQNSLQLPLPLKPHRVHINASGWIVEGVHKNGKPDNQILFKRIVEEETIANQILETGVLPPFLIIDRTLRLGLTWKIETSVRRVSPANSAVVFSYPLLPNESIVSEGIRVKDSHVQVIMGAQQNLLQWESVIEKTEEINLKHANTDLWTELWRVDVSPIFHMETSGIPVIQHHQGNRWYPTWHPWPGEEVTLSISKPAGVEGQTTTIDRALLENKPGRRVTHNALTLSVRSSQGGQHTITLPGSAKLKEVKINGKVLPVRQKNTSVTLPLVPGSQEISLQWDEPSGITSFYKTPEIDLGLDSVNSNVEIHLPRNRWPLFMGGPLMGPAVLFWSVILVIFIVAYGLAKTGLTPLKFHHWFLLGIGMSQSNIGAGILVAAWLILLDLRSRAKQEMDKTTFNLMQTGIAALTVLALSALVAGVSQGLLGHPDMNIVGNGSHSGLLKWYQDHSSSIFPQSWLISIPMLVYRLAMLAWALWISFTLINLLKWGWSNYTDPVIWHKIPRKAKPGKKRAKETDIVQQKTEDSSQ